MQHGTISIKSFKELDTDELYALLKLRQDVFIIEQQSIYDDLDGYDQKSFHLLLWENGALAGLTRIVPAGTKMTHVSIGRIATPQTARGGGRGRRIIEESIRFIEEKLQETVIEISAQEHLESYYESFGFRRSSAAYDDGGIMHIDMIREAHARNS